MRSLLDRESPKGNFVSTDHSAGMRGLLKRAGGEAGGFALCFISFNPARPVALLREEAFLGACGEMGIPASKSDIIRIDSIDEITRRRIRDIAYRYDALFCFNDFVAVYAYQTALLAGLSIPADLALAGYDDSPIRQLTPQKIDTVSLSPYRLGFEAAGWLRSVIIDRSEDPLRRLIPGELVPGETLQVGPGPWTGNRAGAGRLGLRCGGELPGKPRCGGADGARSLGETSGFQRAR